MIKRCMLHCRKSWDGEVACRRQVQLNPKASPEPLCWIRLQFLGVEAQSSDLRAGSQLHRVEVGQEYPPAKHRSGPKHAHDGQPLCSVAAADAAVPTTVVATPPSIAHAAPQRMALVNFVDLFHHPLNCPAHHEQQWALLFVAAQDGLPRRKCHSLPHPRQNLLESRLSPHLLHQPGFSTRQWRLGGCFATAGLRADFSPVFSSLFSSQWVLIHMQLDLEALVGQAVVVVLAQDVQPLFVKPQDSPAGVEGRVEYEEECCPSRALRTRICVTVELNTNIPPNSCLHEDLTQVFLRKPTPQAYQFIPKIERIEDWSTKAADCKGHIPGLLAELWADGKGQLVQC
mmetsp:Transcript_8240/g.17681  ORF Transcript_8240/g.17681 Transcript_8240/m.17681 type:complete len:343 (-) Transcript_8240:161-1189(-)